jgi:hypothetical protein
MKNKKIIYLLIALIYSLSTPLALAGPTSTNFQLLDYGFGSGGVATSSSESFLLQGTAGEIDVASGSSTNFILGAGLTYTLQANVPTAPTFTNPSNYYNKLSLTINNGNNSTDTKFVIQISSGSATFASDVYYVQNDHTLGTTAAWQTYSNWGSGSGITLIGLYPGTTYYARVAARKDLYSQSPYSAVASSATVNPSFTFSLNTTSQGSPPFSVNIGSITPGSVSTSTDKVNITLTTNGTNGGLIYLYGTNNGLKSALAGNYNITSSSTDLSSALEGYGARGTTVTQSAGGPMQLLSPYNGASDNVGVIDTSKRPIADSSSAPVTSGQTSFELKAKAKDTTPSATDYTDILTIIATGSF